MLDFVTRPDGQTIDPEYDPVRGRLDSITIQPSGETAVYGYDPVTGKLTSISGPDADLSFVYDGDLLTRETWHWEGGQTTAVERVYDDFLQLESLQVGQQAPVTFEYDDDGLLERAGALDLVRRPDNGLLESTSIGVVDDQWTYSPFGELEHYTANVSGQPVFDVHYVRDKLGRIIYRTEVIEGVTTAYAYDYDPAGRLWKVWEDAVLVSTYTYDHNGNRLSHTTPSGTTTGTYDDQDRILTYGATSYTHGANGEMKTATDASGTTNYDYDARGNLRSVQLPDGTLIEYLIDARDRRVGRKVNGTLQQRWVYNDQLAPVAELDAAGSIVAEYVYGTRANVPDYATFEGMRLRVIGDHLGGVRLLVNAVSGVVEERVDYDAVGNSVTPNVRHIPIGFAGGLFDGDTSLARFGVRDYSPMLGRWLARDPIRFDAESSNLYEYATNDPVNLIDPTGKNPLGLPLAGIVAAYCTGSAVGGFVNWAQDPLGVGEPLFEVRRLTERVRKRLDECADPAQAIELQRIFESLRVLELEIINSRPASLTALDIMSDTACKMTIAAAALVAHSSFANR